VGSTVRGNLLGAVDRLVTCEPGYLIVGIWAEAPDGEPEGAERIATVPDTRSDLQCTYGTPGSLTTRSANVMSAAAARAMRGAAQQLMVRARSSRCGCPGPRECHNLLAYGLAVPPCCEERLRGS